MRSIFITGEAYGAIKARLLDPTPLPPQGPDGTHPISLDPKFVDRLDQMRAGAGESYSDVILRLTNGDGRSLHIVANCQDIAPAACSRSLSG